VTAIFGDWLSSLLIVQAQPWRMAWLMATAAATALGATSVWFWHFWCFAGRSTPNSRSLVLPLSWRLSCIFRSARFAPPVKPPLVLSTWIFTIAVAAIWKARLLAYPWHFFMEAPAGHSNFELLIIRGYLVLPISALAVYFAIAKPRISPLAQGGAAALLLTTDACPNTWWRRTSGRRSSCG
jgi:hypothetical protein